MSNTFSFALALSWLLLVLGCSRESSTTHPSPTPSTTTTNASPSAGAIHESPSPSPTPAPTPTPAPAIEIAAPSPPPAAPTPDLPRPIDLYSGTHKLGVNRVTDMARIGSATFSRRDGALHLRGRVERGKHWLELEGTVETDGPKMFHLTGTMRGVPDMAWNDEAPRERNTEGRFTFEVRKGRPYWRLYAVNGRDCVCDDRCGNDFCYVDIEQQPTP
jgi:hypothetical protein